MGSASLLRPRFRRSPCGLAAVVREVDGGRASGPDPDRLARGPVPFVPRLDRVGARRHAPDLEDPAFPVWSNATAQPHRPDQVGDSLIRQLVNPVLFSDSLLDMASAGIHTFVHIGPGDVTAGLARRTVEGATVITISTIDDIRSAQEALVSIDRP